MGCGSKLRGLLDPRVAMAYIINKLLHNIMTIQISIAQKAVAEAQRANIPVPAIVPIMPSAFGPAGFVPTDKLMDNSLSSTATSLLNKSNEILDTAQRISDASRTIFSINTGIGLFENLRTEQALFSGEDPFSREWWDYAIDTHSGDVTNLSDLTAEYYSWIGISGASRNMNDYDAGASYIGKLAVRGDNLAWKTIAAMTYSIVMGVVSTIKLDFGGIYKNAKTTLSIIEQLTELGAKLNDPFRELKELILEMLQESMMYGRYSDTYLIRYMTIYINSIGDMDYNIQNRERLNYVNSAIDGDLFGLWFAGGLLYDAGRAGDLFFGEKPLDTRRFLGLPDSGTGHMRSMEAERMGDIANNMYSNRAGERHFGIKPMVS